jgi:hypothetical protein
MFVAYDTTAIHFGRNFDYVLSESLNFGFVLFQYLWEAIPHLILNIYLHLSILELYCTSTGGSKPY